MPETRRHAAIMFTDIVGYTRLMGSDEEKAVDMLSRNRSIHQSCIEKFNGTLIKEIGDGILASFSLASEAVRCAIEIQKECKEEGVPLKIGIHEGEMIFSGSDVIGDGVNIASRLQEDAQEGCIYISAVVYSDIKNKADITTEFIEEKALKNVDEPIKIYVVTYEESLQEITNLKTSDSNLKEKKSIIVLPFVDISPDHDNEYFSDGLTEEIITDLSYIHELQVISRSSAMTFKGTKKTIKEIAETVNVRYVLEGSVRKAGNNLRIIAQLIDGIDDTHLWAEKYTGTLNDIFLIQEKVSSSIAEALHMKLSVKELESLSERTINDIKVYEYYLKAKHEIDTFTGKGLDKAILLLESGLEIAGENSILYSGLGYAYWQYFNITAHEKYINKGIKYTKKALKLNPESSEGHCVTGLLNFFYGFPQTKRNIRKCIFHLKKALLIDPNNCEALFHLEVVYLFLGKTDEVELLLRNHLNIDPLSFYGHWIASILLLFKGKFQQALTPMKKVYNIASGVTPMNFFYALILAYNNQREEAFSIFDSIINADPKHIFSQLAVFLKYALLGKKTEALQSITPQILNWSKLDLTAPWSIVIGYSLIGEKEEALNWLDNWVNLGCINYPFINDYDPFLENIRGEVRFKQLMKRIKSEWKNFEA